MEEHWKDRFARESALFFRYALAAGGRSDEAAIWAYLAALRKGSVVGNDELLNEIRTFAAPRRRDLASLHTLVDRLSLEREAWEHAHPVLVPREIERHTATTDA